MSNCPRREPYFSLPIRQNSPPTAPIWIIFKLIVLFLQMNIIATKMDWNDPVVGQKLHFGPFP